MKVGNAGKIIRIESEDDTFQRLFELGLIEGEEISVLKTAPFGDPIEIRVMNYDLCLRKKEAARVFVETLS